MNRSLSILEWHQMATEGNAPPVRIMLNGGSMAPLIRWNKDHVTIVPLESNLLIGDIVLFAEPNAERYVVHRVWNIGESCIRTWGDNCPTPDEWIPKNAVWGKVVLIERGRREIHPDPIMGIRWARIWHKVGKGYRLINGYWVAGIRRIKKLFV